MRTIVLQDWITVRGTVTLGTITQTPSSWVDLRGYDDVVLFLDVREVTATSGTMNMSYMTAPTKDTTALRVLLPTFALSASSTPRVDRVLAAYAGIPIARYICWQTLNAGTSGPWDATFRLRAAVSAPGRA